MELVNCNLCKSDKNKFLYSKSDALFFPAEFFNVVKCEKCGLGFVNPRPTIKQIGKYYPESFFDNFKLNEKADQLRYEAQKIYIDKYVNAKKSKRLLDIGSGNGEFIQYMNNCGWYAEGVEPFYKPKNNDQLKIYKHEFTSMPINNLSFNVLTAWNVLEHTHDPMAYFIKANQLLVKKGIFIFNIPNFDSLASQKLFAEDIPRHLYFFTKSNIEKYLKKTGFKLEKFDSKNTIFVHNPNRWLIYFLHKILRKPFLWPIRSSFKEFLIDNNLSDNLTSKILYLFKHPIRFIDSLLAPAIGKIERYFGKHFTVIYIARKIRKIKEN